MFIWLLQYRITPFWQTWAWQDTTRRVGSYKNWSTLHHPRKKNSQTWSRSNCTLQMGTGWDARTSSALPGFPPSGSWGVTCVLSTRSLSRCQSSGRQSSCLSTSTTAPSATRSICFRQSTTWLCVTWRTRAANFSPKLFLNKLWGKNQCELWVRTGSLFKGCLRTTSPWRTSSRWISLWFYNLSVKHLLTFKKTHFKGAINLEDCGKEKMYDISRCIWLLVLVKTAKHFLMRDERKFKCICTGRGKKPKIMCASVVDKNRKKSYSYSIMK